MENPYEDGRKAYEYYERMGYTDGYEISGSSDSKQCANCSDYAGYYGTFIGNPLSPFHPNCRCKVEVDWSSKANLEKIYSDFFDPRTGKVFKIAGMYDPPLDLLVKAVNYYLGIAITAADILNVGTTEEDGICLVNHDTSGLVGKHLDLDELLEVWEAKPKVDPLEAFQEELENADIQDTETLEIINNYIGELKEMGEEFYTSEKGGKILTYLKDLVTHDINDENELVTEEICGRSVTLQKCALDSLITVCVEMLMDGEEIEIKIGDERVSSYRTDDDQAALIVRTADGFGWYDLPEEDRDQLIEEAPVVDDIDPEIVAQKEWLWDKFGHSVALPGYSNHQTGEAIDIYPKQDDTVPDDYVEEHVKKYLEENGWEQCQAKYPNGKLSDPNHFNYIGNT